MKNKFFALAKHLVHRHGKVGWTLCKSKGHTKNIFTKCGAKGTFVSSPQAKTKDQNS